MNLVIVVTRVTFIARVMATGTGERQFMRWWHCGSVKGEVYVRDMKEELPKKI